MNSEIVSKVAKVAYIGERETDYGTMYDHFYEMEDGARLKAGHKAQNKFKVGDEVAYEFKGDDSRYGKYGKVAKPKTIISGKPNFDKNWEDREKGIKIGHAINNAVQLVIAEADLNSISINTLKDAIKNYATLILEISDELNNPVSPSAVKEKIAATVAALDVDDDLPF